jgi:hypothetical protein
MESSFPCYLEFGSNPISSGNKNRIAKAGSVKIEEAAVST